MTESEAEKLLEPSKRSLDRSSESVCRRIRCCESPLGPMYLAGPMDGLPHRNHPTFDKYAEKWRALGWLVISPAEESRKSGFDPDTCTPPPQFKDGEAFTHAQYSKDLEIILNRAKVVGLIPGWETSIGATGEAMLAYKIGHEIICAETGRDMRPVIERRIRSGSPLLEAFGLVYGSRYESYGHPIEDFSRTAKMWAAILGCPVTAEEVGMCMIAVKLSRQCHKPARDNITDIAGYAECVHRIMQCRESES